MPDVNEKDGMLQEFISIFVSTLKDNVYDDRVIDNIATEELEEAMFTTVVTTVNKRPETNIRDLVKTEHIQEMNCPHCNKSVALIIRDGKSVDGGDRACPHCKETVYFSATVKFDALPF